MTPLTFEFDANSQPWFHSTVRLNKDDKFRLDVEIKEELKYTGTLEHARSLDGAWVDHTHQPKTANQDYLAPGLWADGIVGQIGEGNNVPGAKFDVVTGTEYVANASGYLQITVNEKRTDVHSDNQGKLGFTVTILDRASQGKLLVAKYGSDQAGSVPRDEESSNSDRVDVEPASLEIIYDSSGSMKLALDPVRREPEQGEKTRREVALEAFGDLLDSGLLKDTKVALRVFGPAYPGTNIVSTSSYQSTLVSPLEAFSVTRGGELYDILKGFSPSGGTPIGASLEAAKDDLTGATGVSVVTLLTDGVADDQNAVDAAAAELAGSVKLVLNIVGFSLSEALQQTYRDLAAANNGTFVSIDDEAQAATNLETAVGLSFEILQNGTLLDRYNVGGSAIDLDPGSYTLKMLIPGNNTSKTIEVEAGKTTLIETRAR